MKTIFREYDIRGIYKEELKKDLVKKIAYLLGLKIKKFGDYVSVAYDARLHSKDLFKDLISGFNKAKIKVLNCGLVPSPVNYFSAYTDFDGLKPNASVMITGSHNPPEYNGFKININKKPFFGKEIYKLYEEVKNCNISIQDDHSYTNINAKEQYIKYLSEHFKDLKGFKEKKIVYDCANGTAGVVIQEIFKNLDIKAKGLFIEPNGNFPNHHPDPSEEKNLKDLKNELRSDYDLAFGFDGDSDRIAVLSKKHNIKGDILAILYSYNIENPLIIGEVKCSSLMYEEIQKRAGKTIMYKTGHSNLKLMLKEKNAHLATEVSGHIFFNDRYFGYDDAIYACFRVIELIKNGIDLDEKIDKLPKVYISDELKVESKEEEKFILIEKIRKELKQNPLKDLIEIIEIDGLRIVLKNGWILIRASNTSPILTGRIESLNEKSLQEYKDIFNMLIKKAKSN